MDIAEVHTLTGGYAADALEDDERAEFERHLVDCAACREEVRGLRETVAVLAQAAAVTPPERVRASVLQAIRTTAQERPVLPVVPGGPAAPAGIPGQPRTAPGRLWLAAAAVLVAATVGSGAVAVGEYRSAEQARARVVTAEAVASVLADPAGRRVQAPVDGGGTATLVVAGSRAALVTASMRGLPADRVYQVWLVRPEKVTSAGLGPGGPSAAAGWQALVGGVRPGDVVALSVEPDGGSAQPTTTPVVTLRA